MDILLREIQEDLQKLNSKVGAFCKAFEARSEASHNPGQNAAPSPAAEHAQEKHVASEQGARLPEAADAGGSRSHRRKGAPKFRTREEEALQDALHDTDADTAQLADADLQAEAAQASDEHQHQQESMDSETMIQLPSSSGPAAAVINSPAAWKPVQLQRIPGPSAPRKQLIDPLEFKRRYMIDEEDDLDLVEAGAGNRHEEASSTQDDSPSDEGTEAAAEHDNSGSEEEEDVDVDDKVRFLSVTRHSTEGADNMALYGNMPGCSTSQDKEDMVESLLNHPARCAERRRRCLEAFMTPTLIRVMASESAKQGVADVGREWAEEHGPGDEAVEDCEAELQGLTMRVAEQNYSESEPEDGDTEPEDEGEEGANTVSVLVQRSSDVHPEPAGGDSTAAADAEDVVVVNAADLLAMAEAQAQREEQVESHMARIMHADIPLSQQLSQAQIRAMVLSILPAISAVAGCSLRQAERRLAAQDILAATATNIESMAAIWTDTELVRLQAAACHFWSKGSDDKDTWVHELAHKRSHLGDLLKKLVLTHCDNPKGFLSSAPKQVKSLELTVNACLYHAALLDISKQAERPFALQQSAEERIQSAAAIKAAEATTAAAAAAAASAAVSPVDIAEPKDVDLLADSDTEGDESGDDGDNEMGSEDDFIDDTDVCETAQQSKSLDRQESSKQRVNQRSSAGGAGEDVGGDETDSRDGDMSEGEGQGEGEVPAAGSKAAYKPHTEVLVEDSRKRQQLATAAIAEVAAAAGGATQTPAVAAAVPATAATAVAGTAADVPAATDGTGLAAAAGVAATAAAADAAGAEAHAEARPAAAMGSPRAAPVRSIMSSPGGSEASDGDGFNKEQMRNAVDASLKRNGVPSSREAETPVVVNLADDYFDDYQTEQAMAASRNPDHDTDPTDNQMPWGDEVAACESLHDAQDEDMPDADVDADVDRLPANQADAEEERGGQSSPKLTTPMSPLANVPRANTGSPPASPTPELSSVPGSNNGPVAVKSCVTDAAVGDGEAGSQPQEEDAQSLSVRGDADSGGGGAAGVDSMGSRYEPPVSLPKECPGHARVTVLPGLLPQPLSDGMAVELDGAKGTSKVFWRPWKQGNSLRAWVAGTDTCMVARHQRGVEKTVLVLSSQVRPAPPFTSSLPKVQLTRGELVELEDAPGGLWQTGVVLMVRLRHTHHFKWSSYPELSPTPSPCGSPSHSSNGGSRQQGNIKPEDIERVVARVRTQSLSDQSRRLSGQHPQLQQQQQRQGVQQPQGQQQSPSPSHSGSEGHVCNPILIPCTPSSGSTLHSVVYLLHPVVSEQRKAKQKNGRIVLCDSSTVAQGKARPCLWWDPESARWHGVAYPRTELLRDGSICLQSLRDQQQNLQLKRQMAEYAAIVSEHATASSTANSPAAVAAAQNASLVHQGHLLSRLLARRPTGQYIALLQSAYPRKRAVCTLHEGVVQEETKQTNPARPFKGKRPLITNPAGRRAPAVAKAGPTETPSMPAPPPGPAPAPVPVHAPVPKAAAKAPESAKNLAKDKEVKARVASFEAKKAQKHQAMLLATSQAEDMDMSEDDEEEGDAEGWVPLFADRPKRHGLPKPKVARFYADRLKPHQLKGLQFIWHNLVEEDPASMYGIIHADAKPDDAPTGVILAHSMGLGKTLTTIAFLHTFFAAAHSSSLRGAASQGGSSSKAGGCGRALLVVPANVLETFHAEFTTWLQSGPDAASSPLTVQKVYMYSPAAPQLVLQWYKQQGSVLLITSKMFSKIVLGDSAAVPILTAKQQARQARERAIAALFPQESSSREGSPSPPPLQPPTVVTEEAPASKLTAAQQENKAAREKELKATREKQREMFITGPTVMVVDEAHELKNPHSQLCRATLQVETTRRIALTGYPLQNNLNEYYAMINWVSPGLMGSADDFKEDFADIIQEGQVPGAALALRRRSALRLSVLQKFVSSLVHRAGPDLLGKSLPPKTEHVLQLKLCALQEQLYALYQRESNQGRKLLKDTSILGTICNNPDVFEALISKAATEQQALQVRGEDEDDGSMELFVSPSQQERLADTNIAGSSKPLRRGSSGDASAKGTQGKKGGPKKSTGKKEPEEAAVSLELCLEMHKLMSERRKELQLPQLGDERNDDERESAMGRMWARPKQAFIASLLEQCRASDEKLVVFSMSLAFLNSVEQCLKNDFGLVHNRGYYRIDGSVSTSSRSAAINGFNNGKGFKVFLLSTRAGSLGINLTSACRLVLADVSWNPVWNAQAVARIFRFGQLMPSFIYRLLYCNTFEQYILKVNIRKEELFQKVVDEKAIRKVDQSEVYAEIYSPYESPSTIMPAKMQAELAAAQLGDSNLAGVAQDPAFPSWIAGYSTHASHFESDPEGTVGRAERRLATAEFMGTQQQPIYIPGEDQGLTQPAPEKSKRHQRLARRVVQSSDDDDDYVPPAEERAAEQRRTAAAVATAAAKAAATAAAAAADAATAVFTASAKAAAETAAAASAAVPQRPLPLPLRSTVAPAQATISSGLEQIKAKVAAAKAMKEAAQAAAGEAPSTAAAVQPAPRPSCVSPPVATSVPLHATATPPPTAAATASSNVTTQGVRPGDRTPSAEANPLLDTSQGQRVRTGPDQNRAASDVGQSMLERLKRSSLTGPHRTPGPLGEEGALQTDAHQPSRTPEAAAAAVRQAAASMKRSEEGVVAAAAMAAKEAAAATPAANGTPLPHAPASSEKREGQAKTKGSMREAKRQRKELAHNHAVATPGQGIVTPTLPSRMIVDSTGINHLRTDSDPQTQTLRASASTASLHNILAATADVSGTGRAQKRKHESSPPEDGTDSLQQAEVNNADTAPPLRLQPRSITPYPPLKNLSSTSLTPSGTANAPSPSLSGHGLTTSVTHAVTRPLTTSALFPSSFRASGKPSVSPSARRVLQDPAADDDDKHGSHGAGPSLSKVQKLANTNTIRPIPSLRFKPTSSLTPAAKLAAGSTPASAARTPASENFIRPRPATPLTASTPSASLAGIYSGAYDAPVLAQDVRHTSGRKTPQRFEEPDVMDLTQGSQSD